MREVNPKSGLLYAKIKMNDRRWTSKKLPDKAREGDARIFARVGCWVGGRPDLGTRYGIRWNLDSCEDRVFWK